MATEYRSLHDQDKVFLFRYYHWLYSTHICERQNNPITITRIRDAIKPFYESKDITNSDIEEYFEDREWLKSHIPNSDEIVFHEGVDNFMKVISDNIVEIFLSDDSFGTVPLSFTFDFFNEEKSGSVHLSSNGFLTFNTSGARAL